MCLLCQAARQPDNVTTHRVRRRFPALLTAVFGSRAALHMEIGTAPATPVAESRD